MAELERIKKERAAEKAELEEKEQERQVLFSHYKNYINIIGANPFG